MGSSLQVWPVTDAETKIFSREPFEYDSLRESEKTWRSRLELGLPSFVPGLQQRLECDESLPTATVLQIRHQILRAAFSTRMARNCSVVSNLVPKKPHPELILPMVLLATSGVFRGRYGFHKLLISSPWKAMAPLRKKSPFTDWYRHSYAHT